MFLYRLLHLEIVFWIFLFIWTKVPVTSFRLPRKAQRHPKSKRSQCKGMLKEKEKYLWRGNMEFWQSLFTPFLLFDVACVPRPRLCMMTHMNLSPFSTSCLTTHDENWHTNENSCSILSIPHFCLQFLTLAVHAKYNKLVTISVPSGLKSAENVPCCNWGELTTNAQRSFLSLWVVWCWNQQAVTFLGVSVANTFY